MPLPSWHSPPRIVGGNQVLKAISRMCQSKPYYALSHTHTHTTSHSIITTSSYSVRSFTTSSCIVDPCSIVVSLSPCQGCRAFLEGWNIYVTEAMLLSACFFDFLFPFSCCLFSQQAKLGVPFAFYFHENFAYFYGLLPGSRTSMSAVSLSEDQRSTPLASLVSSL